MLKKAIEIFLRQLIYQEKKAFMSLCMIINLKIS